MAWVTITGDVVSTATKFGGTDHGNKIANMFNGVDVSDTVTINSAVTWTFENGSFYLRNPADTFSYLFTPSAIVANRTLTLPLLTGTDTVVVEALAQTLTNKTINTASNTITIVEADISDLGSYIASVVADTTPQLGGNLDGQGNDITKLGTISLTEQAAANADVIADGQVWVKTATPNQLWFTDDAGTDFQLASLAGTETLTNKTISQSQITSLTSDLALKATLASPTFTGTVVLPNVPAIVTTQLDLKATLASPALTSPSISYAINTQTGTTYTAVLADAGKIITTSNAGTIAFTIPPNSSVAYPIGSSLTVISIGAGLTTIGQGAGVTIASTGAVATAPVLRIQHSSATAIKIATDTWQVVGDIS
jgi:hypothetical protein